MRVVAPILVVVEIAMFAVAIAHSQRPDPDTFMATLPEPKPLAVGEQMTIGGKQLIYGRENTHRDACRVLGEQFVPYTGVYGCAPVTVTSDDVTGMVMVRQASSWSSSKALRPPDIAKRLAAPVGWTHLAGGGALLASIALVLASAFARRARTIDSPKPAVPGGYRVSAPMPTDEEDPEARRRGFYEARARGARFVALTVAASTGLPLAAALAHGLGR